MQMHEVREMICDYLSRTPCGEAIRVERDMMNIAFPHSMAERDPHGLGTAILTLAGARNGNRPESTQEELIEGFCKAGGYEAMKDLATGDWLISSTLDHMGNSPER